MVVVAVATAVAEGVALLLDGVVVPGRHVLIAGPGFGWLGAVGWGGGGKGAGLFKRENESDKESVSEKTYPGGRQK